MKNLLILVCLFVVAFTFNAKANSNKNYQKDLTNFIDNMAINFEKINKIEDKVKWTESAYEYANKVLDINWISNFILGKHRRTLTPAQKNDFVKYYSIYLLNNYLETLSLFSKENLNIVSIKENKKDVYFVELNIKNKDKEINTDLRIVKKENTFYITDIIAENVSFINSQRNEINSFIDSNGFDALIEKIK